MFRFNNLGREAVRTLWGAARHSVGYITGVTGLQGRRA